MIKRQCILVETRWRHIVFATRYSFNVDAVSSVENSSIHFILHSFNAFTIKSNYSNDDDDDDEVQNGVIDLKNKVQILTCNFTQNLSLPNCVY